MKKLLITSSFITMFLSGYGVALQAEEPKQQFTDYSNGSTFGKEGFYFGVSGGGIFGKSKTSSNIVSGLNTISNDSDVSFNGLSGGIIGGYEKSIKEIYLGVEVTGEASNLSGSSSFVTTNGNTKTVNASLRQTNSIAAVARGGKQIDHQTLLYIKGGVSLTHYRFSSSTSIANLNASASKNKRVWQPLGGLGIERIVGTIGNTMQVRLGGEYEYKFENKTTIKLNSNGLNGAVKFNTSSHAIKARLIFNL